MSNSSLVVLTDRAPALIAAAGARASYRFFEFFTANIRNPHTRRAYAHRLASQASRWKHRDCSQRRSSLAPINDQSNRPVLIS